MTKILAYCFILLCSIFRRRTFSRGYCWLYTWLSTKKADWMWWRFTTSGHTVNWWSTWC